jgi:DNA-binding MarR family transcriptional regulator
MQYVPMTFDRDSSAGYLTNHMARLFAHHLDEKLRPLGLRLGAFPALLHLWETDGLTQKDLVERLGIEQPTMAATLTRMERDGLVTRDKDP